MEFLGTYAALGVGAGLLAGLLGVGGGQVVVPGLLYVFHVLGTSPAHAMHLALGTSLATIVVTSAASVRVHQLRGAVDWSLAGQLSAGLMLGAACGGVTSALLSGVALRLGFGVVLLLLSAQMALSVQPPPRRGLPSGGVLAAAGLAIGWLCALAGIGGGSILVPLLVWHRVAVRTAIGTASACGVPLAFAGAVGFVVAGLKQIDLPAATLGYVYLPAFAMISLGSLLSAPLGARLAHRLPVSVLKRLFSIFLAIAGVRILLA